MNKKSQTLLQGTIDGAGLEQLRVLPSVVNYLSKKDLTSVQPGRHELDSGIFALHQEFQTKPADLCRFESHRKYIDIQVILSGSEKFGIASTPALEVADDYDQERDVTFYRTPAAADDIIVNARGFVVFFPENAHQPANHPGTEPKTVYKIVFKVPVELFANPHRNS